MSCERRARNFVGKLFRHFSSACPTTFLRQKCSDRQCQFLLVYFQKIFHDEQATHFLMKFVRAKATSGPKPKNHTVEACGPDPKKLIRPFFPKFNFFGSRMRSKGSRFTLGVWGLRMCSLDVAQPSATVRNRPQPSATVGNRLQPFATVRVMAVWPHP